jgi:hypothetical protein
MAKAKTYKVPFPLVKAYARYIHCQDAPVSVQQRLFGRLSYLQNDHPDIDQADLEREAAEWWNSRAMRGPGVDW